jgi:hypothetical protein
VADQAFGSAIDPAGGREAVAGEVTYKLQRRYRRPLARRSAAAAVACIVCAVAPHPVFLHDGAGLFGAIAIAFGAVYLWQGRFRTTVTGRGIEMHGYLNHFVPWRDVRAIEVGGFGSEHMRLDETYGGVTTPTVISTWGPNARRVEASANRMAHLASITIVRASGHKQRLRAPLVSGWASDPEFGDKARELQQFWRQYGGGPAS